MTVMTPSQIVSNLNKVVSYDDTDSNSQKFVV